MDKNTLRFMVVMALVIFGFMWFKKTPKPDQTAEDTQNTEVTSPSIVPTPVAAEQLAIVPAVIKEAGVKTDEGTYVYTTPLDAKTNSSATLMLNDTVVSGTIVANGMAFDYADVAGATLPEAIGEKPVTLDTQAAAYETLRQAIFDGRKFGRFSAYRSQLAENSEPLTLANDVISLEISPKGGIISQATLTKKYKTYFPSAENPAVIDTADVVVFKPADNWSYGFNLTTAGMGSINTRDLYFEPQMSADSTQVTMALNIGDDKFWGIRYTLPQGDSYVVKMELISQNMAGTLQNSMQLPMTWNLEMPRQERGRTFEERNSSIYYKRAGHNPDDLGMTSKQKNLTEPIQWIAFKNQFFSTIFIPENSFEGADLAQIAVKDSPGFVKDMAASTTVDLSTDNGTIATFNIFIGPNLYPLLRKVDHQLTEDGDLKLTRIIPLGWSWLRWINTLIIIPVFTFLSGFISSYGLIIFLLTLFIKLILFPFTYKSYMSQAKMRVLAPEIKEINDKFPGKENAMIRQQKTMALYSKAGASPMSGCLPMLLQLPILIAMFSFFPSCIELRGQSFLWAQDLAAPDSILTLPFTIPFYGNHVSLFCLLMTVTNIIYTRINMQNQPTSSSMPGMKWMMYMMPVMFLFFFNDYAAALSYYYFLSLLITIVQTYIFRKCVNEDKVRAKMAENAAKPRKKSGFMARLEEAQRKQQAILRQQQQQQQKGRRR